MLCVVAVAISPEAAAPTTMRGHNYMWLYLFNWNQQYWIFDTFILFIIVQSAECLILLSLSKDSRHHYLRKNKLRCVFCCLCFCLRKTTWAVDSGHVPVFIHMSRRGHHLSCRMWQIQFMAVFTDQLITSTWSDVLPTTRITFSR